MMFLRITAADNTRKYIPDNYMLQFTTAAETLDAGSAIRAPQVVRARINGVSYYDGANGTAGAIVVVAAIPAFTSGGILYEYGEITPDGAFSAYFKN